MLKHLRVVLDEINGGADDSRTGAVLIDQALDGTCKAAVAVCLRVARGRLQLVLDLIGTDAVQMLIGRLRDLLRVTLPAGKLL